MDVAIIGGGIGGLAASIALRNHGVRTTVFERTPTFADIGVGLILSPNGVRALDALGHDIGSDVRRLGHCLTPQAAHQVRTFDGREIGAIRYGEFQSRHEAPFIVVRRTILQRVLLRAHGGEGLRARKLFVSFRDGPSKVVAHFRDAQSFGADLLIGADGIRSTVRGRLFGTEAPRFIAHTLRGITMGHPLPDEFVDGFTVVGPGLGMFFAPLGPGELYWTATINAEPGHWPRDAREAHIRLLERLAGWPPIVRLLVTQADRAYLVSTDLCDRPPLDRWSRGRVSLLGDAAHAMTNFLGQGANTTLEDAVTLARAVAHHGNAAALPAYEQARLERTTRIVRGSATLADGEWAEDTPARFREYLERFLNGEVMDQVYAWRPELTMSNVTEAGS